jgi:hypothetical protein
MGLRGAWAAALGLLFIGGCEPAPGPEPELEVVPEEAAEPLPEPETPETLVDLLHRTRSHVTVSSRVENETDSPEHLVDRRPDTAWNSKTGDLTPTISVQVPAQAWVRRFELTVGYDRVTARGDQFTRNHRIAKVAVERDGGVVGVFELDPNERKPQTIPIDRQGGTFVIRVLETRAGTEARFREVTVSELAVLGIAPDEVLAPDAMPQVGVEGAPDHHAAAFTPFFDRAPYPSLEAMCAVHRSIGDPPIDALLAAEGGADPFTATGPSCSVAEPSRGIALDAPYEIRVLHTVEDQTYFSRLAVRLPTGWYPTDVVLDRSYPGPGCGQASMREFERASLEGKTPTVVFDYVRRRAEWLRMDTGSWEAATRTRVACRPDARGVSCRAVTISATTEDLGWASESMQNGSWRLLPGRWQWTREATLDDAGGFRLGPCVDPKGEIVKCDPSAERWMLR